MQIVRISKYKCLVLAKNDESKAFFQKAIGDYYRYAADSAKGSTLEEVKNGALEGYRQAEQLCKSFHPCNSIRLRLALNNSVFIYEIMNDKKKAIDLAETALKDSLEKINDVDEET